MKRSLKYHIFDTLDSTQVKAKQLSKDSGKIHVVTAFMQTNGKGTFGKTWISPSKSGLYVTFAFEVGHLEHISVLSHLAACAACMSLDPIDPKIKWPNDIQVLGKKIGGVLTEVVDHHAYVGIGLNLKYHDALNEVSDQEVTAYDRHKKPPELEDLLEYLSERFLELVTLWEHGGFVKIKHIYEKYFPLIGKPVIIDTPNGLISGTLMRFSDEGYPILKKLESEETIKHLFHITLDESKAK
jgi:BirA family transcriptional regulator, biotin operon repressor / biotin---[acetyl-CoA-carboxylase] ligase